MLPAAEFILQFISINLMIMTIVDIIVGRRRLDQRLGVNPMLLDSLQLSIFKWPPVCNIHVYPSIYLPTHLLIYFWISSY